MNMVGCRHRGKLQGGRVRFTLQRTGYVTWLLTAWDSESYAMVRRVDTRAACVGMLRGIRGV
jgi:hypothetical protein